MIQMSSRAFPGGSSAFRTRWTRRSLFVTVPSDSNAAFEAGTTTSAISAVLVMKMSCTISASRFSRSLRVRWVSASEFAGFSPMQYTAVRSPRSMPSNISERCQPCCGAIGRPQARSNFSRAAASFSMSWNPVGFRVRVRDLPDRLARDPGGGLAALERPVQHRGAVGLEADRGALDERVVGEAGHDDLAGDRVRERDVRAHVDPEPQVRPPRRARPARVDHDQPRAVPDPFQDVVEEDRMRLPRVRPPQDDEVGALDLLVRAGPAPRSEHRRQTDDRGSVSGAVAAVDAVRAEDLTSELLRDEVHLVRGLRAAEDADPPAGVPLDGDLQSRGGPVEGLVPGRGPQSAVRAHHRLGEPRQLSGPPCALLPPFPGRIPRSPRGPVRTVPSARAR